VHGCRNRMYTREPIKTPVIENQAYARFKFNDSQEVGY